MDRQDIRGMAAVAMGAALLAVCAWIAVPTAIPFTLQTFGVCLVAALLGMKNRTACPCILVYLLLGAVGAPVFSGFRGGFGALLGATGGYLIGFLFTALAVGAAAERFGRRLPALLGSMALGVLLCYAFGTAWFVLVYSRGSGAVGVGTALSWCVLPYLLPDAVKIALAAILAQRLYPLIRKEKAT